MKKKKRRAGILGQLQDGFLFGEKKKGAIESKRDKASWLFVYQPSGREKGRTKRGDRIA